MPSTTASGLFRSNNTSQWRSMLDDYSRAIQAHSDAKSKVRLPATKKKNVRGRRAPKHGQSTEEKEQASKSKSELLDFDRWYQYELPDTLREREPPYMTYDELTKLAEWKQLRGIYRPRLTSLIQSNSSSDAETVTKEAFAILDHSTNSSKRRKKTTHKKGNNNEEEKDDEKENDNDDDDNVEATVMKALDVLCRLHGVGLATASAILAAYDSDMSRDYYDKKSTHGELGRVPFMADEVVSAVPDSPTGRYTAKNYARLLHALRVKAAELNERNKGEKQDDTFHWSAHKVELALWTAAILNG